MKNVVSLVLTLIVTCVTGSLGAQVTDSASYPLPNSMYTVLRGHVELPIEGLWHVRSATDDAVVQLYLIPRPEVGQQQLGRRMRMADRQRRIDQGEWKVRMLHRACLEHARRHDGIGPASVNDIDEVRFRYIAQNLQTSPWPDLDEPAGPFVFMVPKVRFNFVGSNHRVPADRREVLAVELRPYVGDGKHWVLYTDGSCLREPIDRQLVQRYGLKIRPVVKASVDKAEPRPTASYMVIAVRRGDATAPLEVVLYNPIRGDQQTVSWNPSGAEQDVTVVKSLREGRRHAWQPYLHTGPAPVLRSWLTSAESTPTDARRRPGTNLSMFSVLGGRAAIEETLQLQNLNSTRGAEEGTLDVNSLQGVSVKSHPYEEMLGGALGGELTLANLAPHDRFFVYVGKPESILPFLDQGAGFIAAAGAGLTGNRLDYDLTRRYLERLGITRPWLEAVLRSGMVQDMAFILPDLFLIDGTDITVAVRLAKPKMLSGLLQLLRIRGLTDAPVQSLKTTDGRPAYWALRGDVLCISTHHDEIERVLQLIEQDGDGSLGRSPELRYMLTQLPVQPETRLFAYFSDPFVRRLVGPQVKLAQLRRLKARAQLENLTAQTVLARLDGGGQVNSVAELKRMDYLRKNFGGEEYSIDNDGVAHSRVYGSLLRMKTLPQVPVQRVTEAEARAYKQYVDNYSRYWRQFFDPIAVRLNDTDEGSLELTTFILPLIDNSIYSQLRQMMIRHEDQQPLVVPQVEPKPVVQFSANLRDQAWQQIARNFGDLFRRYGGASPALLDDLGPGLHLAVYDADPVIALGSGDVMGAFGGNVLRAGGNQMLMVPVILSVLTRPCSVLVETSDPGRTARYLREAASAWMSQPSRRDNDFRVSFYQVEGRDAWVWTMDIVGIIKLRFGVEVTDRYLVIRNIPWSTQDHVVSSAAASLNGARLMIAPAACRLQLPGLFASAADQERRAAMAGLGRLYPLIISGVADVDSAGERHQQLFGFRPLHPALGEWQWRDYHLISSVYGSALRQRQPDYDPQRPFGLMQTIESLQLSMQFEDAGLRSKIIWKVRKGQ